MSVLNYIVTKLQSGIITFINAVTLANRDYPYHDFHTDTMKVTQEHFRVGENNRGRDGSQTKLFTSKSTLIIATTNAYVTFNSSNNVEDLLLANNFYEFKSNIRNIFYRYATEEGTIYIHVDGVLGDEARSEHF